jgi:hypothetical protein
VVQPTAANLNANVSQATAGNLNATVIGAGTAGTPNAGVVTVQGVSGGTTIPVTAAQATAANLNATVVIPSSQVAIPAWGQAATGASLPANAVLQGLIATTNYPSPTGGNSLVGMMADKAGRPVIVLNTIRTLVGTFNVTSTSATASTLIAGGGTGIFNDIISLTCTNESSTTATKITISDNGTGGNTYNLNVGPNVGAGATINFTSPLPQSTAGGAWEILNSAGVTVDCFGTYAINK